MGGGTDSQTIAELKAQNDRLMSERVITRNLLKAQNNRMDKIEQRMAQDEVMSAVNGLNAATKTTADQTVKACRTWLNDQHAMWQRACDDTFRACFLTDQMYTEVMSALPKPSVLEDVVKGLINGLVGVQPELAIFTNVLKLGMPGEKEVREKRLKAVEGAEEFIKAAFEKAEEGGKTASEKREQIEQHESQLKAKLDFFEDQMEGCSETSSWVTECWNAYQTALDRLPVEQAVTATNGMYRAWRNALGESRPYLRGQVKQLSLLFLYDLLRAFCKQSVTLYVPGLKPLYGDRMHMPLSKPEAMQLIANGDDDIEFDGLDSAKREVMYEFFKQIERLGAKRPEIAEDKDLILNWEFAAS
jgi:hypothetical protein